MNLSNANLTNTLSIQSIGGRSDQTTQLGIVYDVILDEDNLDIQRADENKSKYIGAIRFRLASEPTSNESKLYIAYPKNGNFKSLPVRNEYVSITRGDIGNFLYERTGTDITPNVNGDIGTITTNYATDAKANGNTSKTYSNVFSTGIARSTAESSFNNSYGDYFSKVDGIHKLKLYEGDTLIESRFGQSIRFSGYNNSQNSYSPSITIRNYEADRTRSFDFDTTITEDVNRDGSIIVLGSGDYDLGFIPGTVDVNGNGDFETRPNSFRLYPTRLTGHQVLLNSGRVIISAKTGEFIVYSKKNYGFISDGGLSIDNRLGIDANVGGDINITTNSYDVNFNTNTGKINLGNSNLEPIVKGDTLVRLMSELIDAITQQVYLTPAGSTSPGPTNVAVFLKIRSELRTILSNLNKTS